MSKITDELLAAARVVAPTIASFIPGGPLAVGAFQALSGLVLGHPNGSAEDITAAISTMTPDEIAVVRKGDQDYQAKMAGLGIEADKLLYDDRASARQMQVSNRSPLVPVLAILIVGGFLLITVLKLVGVIAGEDQTLHDLITTLRDGLMLVLAFFFGSSAGSDRKTELLAQANIGGGAGIPPPIPTTPK